LVTRDALEQVVGENAAATHTGPAFFIAAVVVDLRGRLRPGVRVNRVNVSGIVKDVAGQNPVSGEQN
jgi:hypothetical protein